MCTTGSQARMRERDCRSHGRPHLTPVPRSLPPDTTVEGRKFISRGEWEERKKLRCEHAFNASCVNCAPPPILSYKSRATTCGRHAPWPRGICLDCTAPAVDLALQPYRSVDYIQVRLVLHRVAAHFQRQGLVLCVDRCTKYALAPSRRLRCTTLVK